MLELIPEEERDAQIPSFEHLHELLAGPSNYLILALVDEKPIGFTIAYAMPRHDRNGQMAYLYEIGVKPEHRRRGIATRMIDLLKDCLRVQDVTGIWVGTVVENTPAKSLYEVTGAKREPSLVHEFWYEDL